MVKDINPGALGSAPTYLTNVGGILYFVADDGINGSELWKSDGTEAGTVLVKDIALGAATSEPIYLTKVNGSLYFAADNSFDYETRSSYSIRLRTTDQDGLSLEKVFIVNVLNRNEAPTDVILSTSNVAEGLAINTIVGLFATFDADAANSFTYSLVNGAGDTDNAAFNVSGNALRTSESFDFETKSTYTIRIRSTDQGGLFTEKAFVINVTDAPEEVYLSGTTGNDAFVANYTGDGIQSQWLVTRNGTVVFSGVVPAGQNLWIDGLAGTDSIQVVGRAVDDILTLDANRIAVNGAWIRNTNIESFRNLHGRGIPARRH